MFLNTSFSPDPLILIKIRKNGLFHVFQKQRYSVTDSLIQRRIRIIRMLAYHKVNPALASLVACQFVLKLRAVLSQRLDFILALTA